jgi:hypothetical protein
MITLFPFSFSIFVGCVCTRNLEITYLESRPGDHITTQQINRPDQQSKSSTLNSQLTHGKGNSNLVTTLVSHLFFTSTFHPFSISSIMFRYIFIY